MLQEFLSAPTVLTAASIHLECLLYVYNYLSCSSLREILQISMQVNLLFSSLFCKTVVMFSFSEVYAHLFYQSKEVL